MREDTSVQVPMHAAFDEAARQLGLPETSFNMDQEENILHYRYLAYEIYKLRNFLTLKFGRFEGPTVPHAIELIRILGKIEPEKPKPREEDPEIVKGRVKHYLRESFSQPIYMDMLLCTDDLCSRYGLPTCLASQYLIEVVQEGSVHQIGHFVYGKGKEPLLEAAVQIGSMTKTRLIETLARNFQVSSETVAEAFFDCEARIKRLNFKIVKKGANIQVVYKKNPLQKTAKELRCLK